MHTIALQISCQSDNCNSKIGSIRQSIWKSAKVANCDYTKSESIQKHTSRDIMYCNWMWQFDGTNSYNTSFTLTRWKQAVMHVTDWNGFGNS